MGINSITTYEKGLLRANLTLRGHVVMFESGLEGQDTVRCILECIINNGHTAVLNRVTGESVDVLIDEPPFRRSVDECKIAVGEKTYPLRDIIQFVVSEM